MPLKTTALIGIASGKEAAFEAAAATVAAHSRQEAGVLHYNVWREQDGARRYVFDELYADQAAVDAHMASAHFKAFFTAIGPLLDGEPAVIVSQAVDVADAI